MYCKTRMPANVASDDVGCGRAVVGGRGVGLEGAEAAGRVAAAPLGALGVVMVDGVVGVGELGGAVHAQRRTLLDAVRRGRRRRRGLQVALL